MAHIEKRHVRPGKETIHSGHFMVSHFEAEAQDDFDDLAVPVPDEEQNVHKVSTVTTYIVPGSKELFPPHKEKCKQQQLSIEISLTKLFECMTLAYRQKLTSPKWNRFKGIKLRWKDKIRLNNVIWRCWHMQFIKKQNTLVCQFASPLDVDTHVKPEATILEGKYWKRRAEAVIAEYKKWRMFHIMRLLGKGDTSVQDTILDMDTVESISQCSDLAGNMLTDEDYLNFMSDTLFSTITNHQPFAFPDPREIARGASLADFIQPSLGPLQPNLDDFMDTLEPFQELLSTARLPPVPEESTLPSEEQLFQPGDAYDPDATAAYSDHLPIQGTNNNTQMISMPEQPIKNEQMQMYDNGRIYIQPDIHDNMMNTQEMMPSFPTNSYERPAAHEQVHNSMHTSMYPAKSTRMQYVSAPKIAAQQDTTYTKYTSAAAIPPSQTAPETVSLLQQPVQNPKYASTVALQGRSAYREKPRPRLTQYSNQLPNHYQGYGQSQPTAPVQPPHQMQYLQPNTISKLLPSQSNTRPFKMPSPPLTVATQQVSGSNSGGVVRGKEQFRSHSLPLGSQLNPDWSVSAPSAPPPAAPVFRNTARSRESTPSTIRIRSRSTSSGGGSAGGAAGTDSATGPGPVRRPPPLNSVASEPALPQATVMLARLLSTPHSQSMFKLNSNSEEAGACASAEPTRSPVLRGQPSPIGSDVMSPHHSLSPPLSPGSPRSGSPRRTHIHAEQKRRYNIKNGFDTLQHLIPHLNANPAAKISKAAMLQKGAEYIKQLKAERNQVKEEMESLRQQIERLNNSISNFHSMLPATGAPVSRARASRLREMFARHVASRSIHSWKYWLFSVVCATLVESFSACVSSSSGADLVRTTLLWAEQHCSLVELRPAVLNSLRVLCTTTDILTNPERLPEEARAAATAGASIKTEPS